MFVLIPDLHNHFIESNTDGMSKSTKLSAATFHFKRIHPIYTLEQHLL